MYEWHLIGRLTIRYRYDLSKESLGYREDRAEMLFFQLEAKET